MDSWNQKNVKTKDNEQIILSGTNMDNLYFVFIFYKLENVQRKSKYDVVDNRILQMVVRICRVLSVCVWY